LQPVDGLLTVGDIRFHKGEPDPLRRPSASDQKLRGEATVTTTKVKHPDAPVPHGQAMEVRCVGTYICLDFCGLL
jgi:hypothetical protein